MIIIIIIFVFSSNATVSYFRTIRTFNLDRSYLYMNNNNNNVDREDAGKKLMYADGYTMTKIVVLTKVVLMTIIPKLLLCLLLRRSIIIFNIISKTIMTTNGCRSRYRSRKSSYLNFFKRFRHVRTYRSNDT